MIVAVVGGQGGVGKSTVALNLAAALDAVLVDADLTHPDQPTPDGPSIQDVLAGRVDPTRALDTSGPVDHLPSRRSLAGARAADFDALEETVETLHRRADHVVIDAPPGRARDVGHVLLTADVAVVVTTPTEASVAGAEAMRELALDANASVGAVVRNRVRDDGLDADIVETRLQAPVVSIEESATIADAMASGRPVAAVDDASAAEPFERIRSLLVRVGR